MAKISVIVPVYNTEKYLRRCLDSLVNQSMQDIEIIVVNDGSKDNSQSIIEEYEKKYPIVKGYIKENGGLSDARNFGVEKATGEYLCFVDSDDYIDLNLFLNLYLVVKPEVEMLKYKAVIINEEAKELEKIDGPVFDPASGEEAFSKLMGNDLFLENAWLYMYKTSFYKENNFKFAKGKYHEDLGLVPLIMLKAKSVMSVKAYGYFYVQTNDSITRSPDYSKTVKRIYDVLDLYDNMIEVVSKYDVKKESFENIKIFYSNILILKTAELKKEDKKKYIKELKNRKIINNIKARNAKQLLKKVILNISIPLYLKLR